MTGIASRSGEAGVNSKRSEANTEDVTGYLTAN